jgi:ABC-type glycerol-3-phosphate transport system permease component
VWIPRFVLFGALNLVGTYAPLVAPALMGGSPLFVLLYVLAFRRIPPDLFEAARMEGIGPVGIQIALLRRWGGRQTERLEPRPAGPQVPST